MDRNKHALYLLSQFKGALSHATYTFLGGAGSNDYTFGILSHVHLVLPKKTPKKVGFALNLFILLEKFKDLINY